MGASVTPRECLMDQQGTGGGDGMRERTRRAGSQIKEAIGLPRLLLGGALLLLSCGGEGETGDAGGMSAEGSTGGSSGGSGSPGTVHRAPGGGVTPAESGGEPGGDACGEGMNGVSMILPGSGSGYCVKANPDCTSPQASCPLYITLNTKGALFNRVDDAETNGPFITVESRQSFDGEDVKDPIAELPRVITKDYPGLDDQRIYLVGWSAGAGALVRGLCQSSKGFDESPFGTTSDVYAAMVSVGGCVKCSDNFEPISGQWHVFAANGENDPFAGDGCEDALRAHAMRNGCSQPDAPWCNVPAGDDYLPSADGSDSAVKLSFGQCPGGDVVGYRFKDEEHVLSYDEHFDPRVRAYDVVWAFLQGRTKSDGGTTGGGSRCGE